jgi:hypothetical protein
VEAVIMRYDTRLGKYGGKPRPGGLRATLCISSQVRFSFFSAFIIIFCVSNVQILLHTYRLDAKWVANSVQLEVWDSKVIYPLEKLLSN